MDDLVRMRSLSRAVGVALVVGSLGGAVALRPAPASSPALVAFEPTAQSAAVTQAQLLASRREATLARRHQAALVAHARPVAARPRAAATPRTLPATPAVHRVVVGPAISTLSPTARAQRIYAGFHYDIGRLGYRIVFRPSTPGLLGLTDSVTRTIALYVRPSESDLVLAHTIAHEMGHALDFTGGTALKHQQYQAVRRITRSASLWYGCNDCTDYTTSAGDWAEVFAQWLAGPGDYRSKMAPAPTSAQLLLLAPLFRL